MRRLLVAALVSLLALTGCGVTSLPTAGPVEEVPVGAQQRGVEIAPEPPQEGVTPSRLVEGFLQAMADPEADYSVARTYLTRAAREAWEPAAGATIYSGTVTQENDVVRVAGQRTGTLDASGRYTAAPGALSVDLGLVEEDGEWRIGAPPPGVLISNYIFLRYYAHTKVYFMRRGVVVPDLLHVPEALLTPSRIVEAQVAWPSSFLAETVDNAIPAGVSLGDEGASVDAQGVAHVALEGVPGNLDEQARADLGTQLVWSMTAIPRVTGLRVTADGVPLALPGQNDDGVLTIDARQDAQALSRAASPDLFGVRDEKAGRFSAAGAFLPMQSGDVPVSEVAVSLDATNVAFIDNTRRTVLLGPLGGSLTRVVPRLTNIRHAQFLRNELWLMGTMPEGGEAIVRVDAFGRTGTVDLSGITSQRVVAFSISQTGARLALVLEDGKGTRQLGIASMGRGNPVRAVSWAPLHLVDGGAELADFAAIEFSGETEIVLISGEVGRRSVHGASFDGSEVNDLGLLMGDPVEIAALPRMGGGVVALRTEEGRILRYQAGTRWTQLPGTFADVSFPG